MALVPAFQIGVWNVWIFMVAWVFFHVVPFDWPIFRYDIKAIFKKGSASTPYKRNEKILNNLGTVIWIVLFIYSGFLPLPLGTPWLYAGIAIFVLGLIIVEIASIPWYNTPFDEPITRGMYRYSRHPMHLAPFITLLGTSMVTSSWLLFVFSTVFTVLRCISVISEERAWLEKYGDPYRKYMDRTPRWIGIPESAPES